VSENDSYHCAVTTKVVVKVMGRDVWRGKPWGDLGNRHRGCGRDVLRQTDRRSGSAATGKARSPGCKSTKKNIVKRMWD